MTSYYSETLGVGLWETLEPAITAKLGVSSNFYGIGGPQALKKLLYHWCRLSDSLTNVSLTDNENKMLLRVCILCFH